MGNAPVNSFTRDHPEEVSCKWLSPPVAETHKEQHSLAERPANTGSLFMRTSNRRLMFLCPLITRARTDETRCHGELEK